MKRYIRADNIFAMSQSRKVVLNRLVALSDVINRHIIECVVYRDSLSSTLPHWVHEIAVWLQRANTLKCKSRLKARDYEDSLFGYFGDDKEDARNNLIMYQLWNARSMNPDRYPDFEITDDMVDRLFSVYRDITTVCEQTLVSGEMLSVNEWGNLISPILTK